MYNFCKSKIIKADGTASAVSLRDDLNSRQLEQSDFLPGYTPHGRQKKTRDQLSNNKNQLGDNDGNSIALGPSPGTDGIGSDNDRGEDARKVFDQWFGNHEYLWERQTSSGGPGSAPFMTGGDGYGEPAIDGGQADQADSPIGSAAKVRRESNPLGNKDNPNPHSRLPGSNGIGTQSGETQRERDRKLLLPAKPIKAFNQFRRKEQIGPLDLVWTHLKKGSAE